MTSAKKGLWIWDLPLEMEAAPGSLQQDLVAVDPCGRGIYASTGAEALSLLPAALSRSIHAELPTPSWGGKSKETHIPLTGQGPLNELGKAEETWLFDWLANLILFPHRNKLAYRVSGQLLSFLFLSDFSPSPIYYFSFNTAFQCHRVIIIQIPISQFHWRRTCIKIPDLPENICNLQPYCITIIWASHCKFF